MNFLPEPQGQRSLRPILTVYDPAGGARLFLLGFLPAPASGLSLALLRSPDLACSEFQAPVTWNS